jgi:hypothetical protein
VSPCRHGLVAEPKGLDERIEDSGLGLKCRRCIPVEKREPEQYLDVRVEYQDQGSAVAHDVPLPPLGGAVLVEQETVDLLDQNLEDTKAGVSGENGLPPREPGMHGGRKQYDCEDHVAHYPQIDEHVWADPGLGYIPPDEVQERHPTKPAEQADPKLQSHRSHSHRPAHGLVAHVSPLHSTKHCKAAMH